MLRYAKEDIELTLNLLNALEVTGIENCKRVAYIDSILRKYQEEGKEDADGNHGTGIRSDS